MKALIVCACSLVVPLGLLADTGSDSGSQIVLNPDVSPGKVILALAGSELLPGFVPFPSPWSDGRNVPAGDTAPAITAEPAGSQSVDVGGAVTLSVTATGTPAPSYQWFRNNRPISGANAASYSITSATISDAGVYTVGVFSVAGYAVSTPALVSVVNPAGFTTAPSGITLAISPTSAGDVTTGTANAGANVTLSTTAAGSGLTYQWLFNDAPISGATASTLTIDTVASTAAGAFSLQISNSSGVVAVEESELLVHTDARLLNLSVFGQVGVEHQPLIVGFVIGGTGSKSILVRGVGPTLASSFGLSGTLAQPELTLYGGGGGLLASNTAWGSSGLTNAFFQSLGAFPLAANSDDTALLQTLSTGVYTAQVSGPSGATGTALLELYDADTAASPTATLVNVSGRGYVTNGTLQVGSSSTQPIIAGLVIGGTTADTVLIRGVGPGLMPFGVFNAVAHTVVTLYNSSGAQIATDAGWGNDLSISAAGNLVGAFPLAPGSGDSALLVTLPPGSYTAQVAGADGASGGAMVEVYEVK